MAELQECMKAPSHMVPTVEFTVYNMELPLCQADYNFFNQPEINIFAGTAVQNTTNAAPSRATSHNLTDMTLTFDNPFILMGLCVYAYADPVGFVSPGNCFGPRAAVAAGPSAGNDMPLSPDSFVADDAALSQMFNVAAGVLGPLGITPNTCLPAMLDWGGPAWRLLWAFMHSYRLEMKCPMSSWSILMNEALSDIGNCCGQVEWGGFGNSEIDPYKYIGRVNNRMNTAATSPTVLDAAGNVLAADPGIFFPTNGVMALSAAGAISTQPQHQLARIASYGRPISTPTVEQWYRLPCPIPFPAVPQPKLKITLRQQDGDQGYLARLLQEGLASHNTIMNGLASNYAAVNPVAGLGFTRPVHTDTVTVPGGQLRIGIGLKGFDVHPSVCEEMSGMIANMGQIGAGGLVCGPTDRVSIPVGSFGNPDAR